MRLYDYWHADPLQGERTIFAFNEDYVENPDPPTLSLSFKDDRWPDHQDPSDATGCTAIRLELVAGGRPTPLSRHQGEVAIMQLILRDLGGLRTYVRDWVNDPAHCDAQLAEALTGEDADTDEVLATVLNSTICRALAYFDFALETGDDGVMEAARSLLITAVSLADHAENVPLWWIASANGLPVPRRTEDVCAWRPTMTSFRPDWTTA